MKHHKHEHLLNTISHERIIERTEPLILDSRLHRINTVLSERLGSIHLVFECPNDIHNAIAAVRTAEAFGIVNIHIIAPDNEALFAKTISQSAIYWVNLHYHESLIAFEQSLPTAPCRLAGGIMSGNLTPSTLPVAHPIYLLFGNEHRGLSTQALNLCDTQFRIPMSGMSESLNLSVSAAITSYEITRRKRTYLKGKNDLSIEEAHHLKAKYYLNSISKRFLSGLFPEAHLK